MPVIAVQSFNLYPATVKYLWSTIYDKETKHSVGCFESFNQSLVHHPVESEAPAITFFLQPPWAIAICLHQPRAKSKLSVIHHAPPLLTTLVFCVQVSPRDLSASAGGHLKTKQPASKISVGSHCHHSLILFKLKRLPHRTLCPFPWSGPWLPTTPVAEPDLTDGTPLVFLLHVDASDQ